MQPVGNAIVLCPSVSLKNRITALGEFSGIAGRLYNMVSLNLPFWETSCMPMGEYYNNVMFLHPETMFDSSSLVLLVKMC